MRRTRFVNAQTLTLGTALQNATETSVVLSDASSLPAEGDFNITIGSEIMLVTHRVSDTLTVVRGVDDTIGTSHSSGANVHVIATKTGMEKIIYDSGLPRAANPTNLTVSAADFSWDNQGSSTLDDATWGGLVLAANPAGGSHNMRIAYFNAPTEPWTLTANIGIPASTEYGVNGSHAGLILGESSSTKWETVSLRNDSGLSWWRWNSVTTYASTVGGVDFQTPPIGGQWMRWVNDGTNIQAFVSVDGVNWLHLASAASKTAWLSTDGPEYLGFYYSNHQLDGESINLNAWLLT